MLGIRIILYVCIGISIIFGALSCSSMNNKMHDKQYQIKKENIYGKSNLLEKTKKATELLVDSCDIISKKENKIIIVTSLVNIDNLKQSSTLGRMSSEIIANRLSQIGFNVKEIKMGSEIFVNVSSGEFILSRELREIGEKHEVNGFVVGTYAVSKDQLFIDSEVIISLRYVDTNNMIACSHSYVIENANKEMWQ